MTITLTPEQQAWIDAHVARGDYASTEEAARSLIDAAILDLAALEADDLAWANPLVDEALAASARGEVMTLDEHRARNKARLAWAKPLVDEALAEVERGEVMSYEEHQADMRKFFETLRRQATR